ncbi:MAG: glycosyltransferase family 4 protein [Candidatus Bathyarchaeota archaeon]|nr:glycosyltransferase family 4 protein [Candidatus Bathyarchaeota archaeon]
MKLCFTSHRYAPLIGGYENQIRLLAENLSKYFPVKVVTFNLTNTKPTESINNVEVYRVKPQLVFFRVPLSINYLKTIGSMDYDLLHAHGFVPVVSDLSIAYAKSKKKATVYTHHFDGNVQDAKTWNTLADLYNKTVAKTSFRYADAIVATTKSYAQTSPALKPQLDRVKIIPCFVDCEAFKPQPKTKTEQLRRKLGLGNRKTVLFVGRIVPYKGLEYLIKAVDYAKTALGEELNLLVLGGEEGKNITDKSIYQKQIQLLSRECSASQHIQFLGKVSGEALSTYYSLADVAALPSTMRGEAFGSVLLEALSCGTPVVASNLPGVGDVLKNNKDVGNYVPPKDHVLLAKALVRVANRKLQVSSLCREFVLENYRVEKIVQDYLRLYSSLKR